MDLANTRVLIVGGTSGIGLAIAKAVAARGATPIVVSRNRSSVDRALAELGGSAEGATVDLAVPVSVAALSAHVGAIDHLAYTAGEPLSLRYLADITPDIAQSFFATRYVGALTVLRALVPSIRAGGSVTLTSGSAGDRPGAGWALGASICGAINSLTRALAIELAPLRVNAIAPGVLRSPLWGGMTETERETMYDSVGAALPLGRVGDVDDVAEAFVYAMMQDYGTGVVLPVDGGTVIA
ncbi:SDR family oxidoreductase [Lacisediminihabitans sp. FW035]